MLLQQEQEQEREREQQGGGIGKIITVGSMLMLSIDQCRHHQGARDAYAASVIIRPKCNTYDEAEKPNAADELHDVREHAPYQQAHRNQDGARHFQLLTEIDLGLLSPQSFLHQPLPFSQSFLRQPLPFDLFSQSFLRQPLPFSQSFLRQPLPFSLRSSLLPLGLGQHAGWRPDCIDLLDPSCLDETPQDVAVDDPELGAGHTVEAGAGCIRMWI